MLRRMRNGFIGLTVLALVGCESAVLVNNRPDRAPADANLDNQSQTASATIERSDDEQAQAAAATQPADQRVNTKNVQIESQSD